MLPLLPSTGKKRRLTVNLREDLMASSGAFVVLILSMVSELRLKRGEGEAGERGEENSSPPPRLVSEGKKIHPPRAASHARGERGEREDPPLLFRSSGGERRERGPPLLPILVKRRQEEPPPPRASSHRAGEREKKEKKKKRKGGGVSNPFLILISILLINLVFYQFL